MTPTSAPRFTDKVAFVTGAGSGIGRVTALAFAAEGARVAVVGNDTAAVGETAGLISAAGGSALALTCDMSVETDVRTALAATARAFGGLDVAFNNAGVEQSRTSGASSGSRSQPRWSTPAMASGSTRSVPASVLDGGQTLG